MEILLLLWHVGLSTVNHLTAFCELLTCSYRRVRWALCQVGCWLFGLLVLPTYWQLNALWIGNFRRLEQMLEMICVAVRTVFKPSISCVMGKVKCIKRPSSYQIYLD